MKRLSTFLMALLLTWIGASAQGTEMPTLQNPSFEDDTTGGLTVDTERASASSTGAYKIESITGWTLKNAPTVCDIMTADATATDNSFGAPGAPSDGTYMLYLHDSWDEGDLATTLTQTVSLEAGTYKLTVDSKCIHNGVDNVSPAKLVAGGEHAELPYHSLFVPDNWDETSVTFMLATAGDVEIGVEITFSNGQAGFSVLLDNFTLTKVTDMELTAHYEEAEDSHWSLTTTGSNIIERNTWSVEVDTESGMAVPFMQYWAGAGNNLPAATISHKQLVGLPAGDYIVSVFARAFNERSTTTVGNGITFTANGQRVDLTTGKEGSYTGHDTNTDEDYNCTEVYGVYTLNCTVDGGGTLDIGFTVASETACDWLAWKDLKVVMDTKEYPTLTALTGEMTQRAKTNMETALATYAANHSGDNFLAAIDALQKAQESIEAYANGATIEEDDYLIINVESGYYLAGGQDWGTHAIEGGKPQFFTLETYGSGGVYSLDSHQSNGGDYHYFGATMWVDNLQGDGWQITYDAKKDAYTLYNTTSSNSGYLTGAGFHTPVELSTGASNASYWRLVSRDEVIASMDNASTANPVDVSALIPACETKHNPWGDYHLTGSQNTGSWIMTGYGVENVPANYTMGSASSDTLSCSESYHSSNGFDIRQTVSFPKKGYYILTSEAFYRMDNRTNAGNTVIPSMYAGSTSVDIRYLTTSANNTTDATKEFIEKKHTQSMCLYVDRDNTSMEVGFTSNYAGDNEKWACFGELGLQYLGDDDYIGFVVHDEEAALGDWTNTGTNAFQYNTWSGEADASGMVTPFLEYWAYQTALSAATISHKQLTGLAAGVYEVSMDIRILNELSGSTVGEGTLLKATTGSTTVSQDILKGIDATDGSYTSGSTTDEDVYGTYTLYITVAEGGSLDICLVIPDGVAYDWIAFKNLKVTYLGADATPSTVKWNLGAEYGTMILPFDYDLSSDGLTAYTIASVDDETEDDDTKATLTLSDGTTSIAAGTPYIIGGETTDYYTFSGVPTKYEVSYDGETTSGIYLTGTLVNMSLANGDFTANSGQYVLQKHDGDEIPAFYPITDQSTGVTLNAYHCYLTDSDGANHVRASISFPSSDGETTAIEAVESAEAEANGAIYDLSGRRVSKAVKGVYIQNGKKVLVK